MRKETGGEIIASDMMGCWDMMWDEQQKIHTGSLARGLVRPRVSHVDVLNFSLGSTFLLLKGKEIYLILQTYILSAFPFPFFPSFKD